jgi:hypothetical protein
MKYVRQVLDEKKRNRNHNSESAELTGVATEKSIGRSTAITQF